MTETVPVAPVPVAAAPAPVTAPVPAATAVRTTSTESNDVLPLAGAAGAALLLLGGGIYAFRRRRDDEVAGAETVALAPAPLPEAPLPASAMAVGAPEAVPYVAPIPVAPRTTAPIQTAANTLPAGFDLSRFGRHTQAAYQGPTDANPFLSLRRRLKRASFFDQREREASQGMAQAATAYAQTTASQAPAGQRRTDHVTTKVTQPIRPNFRPAFSS